MTCGMSAGLRLHELQGRLVAHLPGRAQQDQVQVLEGQHDP